MFGSLGETVRHALFTVASLISTTGFSTTDFDLWPGFSKMILLFVMFVGACAGSTGGGIKISRIIILFKGMLEEIKSLLHPRRVNKITMDGRAVEPEIVRSVNSFIVFYILVFGASVLILSLNNLDFATGFSAVTATVNNIGPGFSAVGPTQNYAFLSPLSKSVLIFDMLAGRLELFPMLLLFTPATWRNK
jgi:trk system potassium uptake protein TrkH